MWPIQLAFLLFTVCKIIPVFLDCNVPLLHFSHDRSSWSPSFSSTTFQNFPGISNLLSAVSKFPHHKKPCPKCSILIHSSLNVSPVCRCKEPSSCWTPIRHGNPGFNFVFTSCVICYRAPKKNILQLILIYHDLYWGRLPKILITIIVCTFISIPYHRPTSISLSVTSCSTLSSLSSSTRCIFHSTNYLSSYLENSKPFESVLRKVFAV